MDIKRKLTIEQKLYNRYNQREWMKINSKIQVQDDVKGVNKSMNVTTIFTIVLIVGICVAAVILAAARICFEIVFRVPKSESLDLYRFPKSEQYSQYTDEMTALIKNALNYAIFNYEKCEPISSKLYFVKNVDIQLEAFKEYEA